MGHEGKGLKDHAHVVEPKLDQFLRAHGGDLFAVYDDLACGRLDKPVEHAHDGGLAPSPRAP